MGVYSWSDLVNHPLLKWPNLDPSWVMDLEPPPVNKAWYKILHVDKLTETGVRVDGKLLRRTSQVVGPSWFLLWDISSFTSRFFFQKFHEFFDRISPLRFWLKLFISKANFFWRRFFLGVRVRFGAVSTCKISSDSHGTNGWSRHQ